MTDHDKTMSIPKSLKITLENIQIKGIDKEDASKYFLRMMELLDHIYNIRENMQVQMAKNQAIINNAPPWESASEVRKRMATDDSHPSLIDKAITEAKECLNCLKKAETQSIANFRKTIKQLMGLEAIDDYRIDDPYNAIMAYTDAWYHGLICSEVLSGECIVRIMDQIRDGLYQR